jgi:hypothetical protein
MKAAEQELLEREQNEADCIWQLFDEQAPSASFAAYSQELKRKI